MTIKKFTCDQYHQRVSYVDFRSQKEFFILRKKVNKGQIVGYLSQSRSSNHGPSFANTSVMQTYLQDHINSETGISKTQTKLLRSKTLGKMALFDDFSDLKSFLRQ